MTDFEVFNVHFCSGEGFISSSKFVCAMLSLLDYDLLLDRREENMVPSLKLPFFLLLSFFQFLLINCTGF